jgi:hypothetical protein
MSTDHDTRKSSESEKRPHHDDDEESHRNHDWAKATVDADTARRAIKRVAQAPAANPKNAHATSNDESVQAARQTLSLHTDAVIDDAAAIMEAVNYTAMPVKERTAKVLERFQSVSSHFTTLANYCDSLHLDRDSWSKLAHQIKAVEHSFDAFKRAMGNANTSLSIKEDKRGEVLLVVQKIIATSGVTLSPATVVGLPTTAQKKSLPVTAVIENLEAARAAADSVIAGNTTHDEVARLVAHLTAADDELEALKSDKQVYAGTAQLRKDVLARLNALEAGGHFATNGRMFIVKNFRKAAQ